MMRIPCPFCGLRDEREFTYGGPAQIKRPNPEETDTAGWVDYLTTVPNPLGPVREHWWHERGCGSLVEIWRDTRTHDIVEAPQDAE